MDEKTGMPIMNRNIAFAILVLATMALVGCAGSGSNSVDVATIEAQIRQADLALLRAEEQRDLVSVMEYIAPNAVFQPPGYPPIVGHDAIRRFYDAEWFQLPFLEISGEPEAIIIGSSGDMAYFDGRSQLVFEISGERTVVVGKYLGVWQKISGQWKLAAISWSGNEPTR